jgi:hypothetical protein
MRHHDSYSEPAYNENKQWPRTEADEIAERKTEEAWEEKHPGTQTAIAEKAISTFIIPRMSSELPVVATEESEAGVTITDRRRVTLQSAEADFQATQEALRAPLEDSEVEAVAAQTLIALDAAIGEAHRAKESADIIQDLEGDRLALILLRDIKKDAPLGAGIEGLRDHTQSIAEQLHAAVDYYAGPVFTTSSKYIASMGGTVGEGTLHYQGYNNGNLYKLTRALQVYEKLQDDPKFAREQLLSGDTPGVDYLLSDPVVVDAKVPA